MLEAPDAFHLKAAEGWLELGNHLEANEELERISPQLRAHPYVLDLRWQIYAKEKKWDACVEIAHALTKISPKKVEGWIHCSYALHELKKTGEAKANLLQIAGRFPKCWTIPYNLACYDCQLGNLKEARAWLKKAFEISGAPEVKQMALSDPDLEPSWMTKS